MGPDTTGKRAEPIHVTRQMNTVQPPPAPPPLPSQTPRPKVRRSIKIFVGCIVALGIYPLWRDSQKEAKKREDRKAELQETPEGRIRFVAEEIFGDRLKKFEASKITGGSKEGQYNVDVTFQGGLDYKSGIDRELRDGFERFFKAGLPIWEVWLRKDAKLVDKFGAESVDLIYKVSMTKDTAGKINWENKALLDFTDLWEAHFIHPALLKE